MIKMLLISPVLLWIALFYQVFSFAQTKHGHCEHSTGHHFASASLIEASCQPRETLVEVWKEFPEEMDHRVLPCAVPVRRCGGYCADEATACLPRGQHTVLVQLIRSYFSHNETIVRPFVEHSDCVCRKPYK